MPLRELAESPGAYVHTCTVAAGESWDPTAVLSATLLVYRPDGVESSWSAVISGQTAAQLVLTHTLAVGGGDIPTGSAGAWRIRPRLVGPFGVIYCTPVIVPVKARFEP
jgi:hypothetical protein